MEIIDELEELVFLENPRIIVTEWFPCGRNQILSLTDGLEAVKEVNDALYTTTMDVPTRLHTLVTGPVLTKLQMRDHDPASYIRFHAKVFYPETVRQLEEFGVHVDWTGRVIYGMVLVAAFCILVVYKEIVSAIIKGLRYGINRTDSN